MAAAGEQTSTQGSLPHEPSANTAGLALAAGGGRKAPEIPKGLGTAPLWNFNPRLNGRSRKSSSWSCGETAGGGDRECRGV